MAGGGEAGLGFLIHTVTLIGMVYMCMGMGAGPEYSLGKSGSTTSVKPNRRINLEVSSSLVRDDEEDSLNY